MLVKEMRMDATWHVQASRDTEYMVVIIILSSKGRILNHNSNKTKIWTKLEFVIQIFQLALDIHINTT